MKDIITVTLFSKQVSAGFTVAMFNEKENIKVLKDKMNEAASKAGNNLLEIVISVLLIPDWTTPNNGYDNKVYQEVKRAFLARINAEFEDIGVTIQDIYQDANLTDAEKSYMHELKAIGSNADIMKTRAIINNAGNRHLQIDSNTKIHSYDSFYNKTFNTDTQEMALCANHYNWCAVSGNNKTVYLPAGHDFAEQLKHIYLTYCDRNKDNAEDKLETANSVYQRTFVPALALAGLVTEIQLSNKKYHQVNTAKSAYRVTRDIVVAINKSWSANASNGSNKEEEEEEQEQELNSLAAVQIGDAKCDFKSWRYLIKKYTSPRLYRAVSEDDKTVDSAILRGAVEALAALHAISDRELDLKIISEFFKQAYKDNAAVTTLLSTMIPDTVEGDQLVNSLFNCTVKEFHTDPIKYIADKLSLSASKASCGNSVHQMKTVLKAVRTDHVELDHSVDPKIIG